MALQAIRVECEISLVSGILRYPFTTSLFYPEPGNGFSLYVEVSSFERTSLISFRSWFIGVASNQSSPSESSLVWTTILKDGD